MSNSLMFCIIMKINLGDLMKTVKILSEESKFNYLVIESTGSSEPLPAAQTFAMDVDSHTHGPPPPSGSGASAEMGEGSKTQANALD